MADTMYGMRKLIVWAKAANAVLNGAVNATVTNITVNGLVAPGFNTALSTFPHKIMIDTEIMDVTGPAVAGVVPVARAQDGTTGASHLDAAAIQRLTPVRIMKVSEFTVTPDIQTIPIPGDGTVEQVFSTNGINGTLTMNKWVDDVLVIALGATLVNTNIDASIASMIHPELGTYPLVQMDVDQKATDGDNNDADITRRTIIWKAKLQNPFVPGAAGNNALQPTQIKWSASPTTTDLLGRSIPGATAAIHYTTAKLA